jgi:hypothetical protein
MLHASPTWHKVAIVSERCTLEPMECRNWQRCSKRKSNRHFNIYDGSLEAFAEKLNVSHVSTSLYPLVKQLRVQHDIHSNESRKAVRTQHVFDPVMGWQSDRADPGLPLTANVSLFIAHAVILTGCPSETFCKNCLKLPLSQEPHQHQRLSFLSFHMKPLFKP